MTYPAEDSYLRTLGLATFHFARLEWQIVWLIEKLYPEKKFIEKSQGYTQERASTAGQIADCFLEYIKKHPQDDSALQMDLENIANSFKKLVQTRNSLMHAKPITAENNEQRLHYNNPQKELVDWTEDKIREAAQEFEELERKANDIFYKRLHPVQATS